MSTAITAFLEYLILKMLTGNRQVVEALRLYLVDDLSPSTIALRLGLSKHQVRGYAQRVIEKIGDYKRASIVLSKIYDVLIRIEPVVRVYGYKKLCILCGKELSTNGEDHIKRYHRELLEDYAHNLLTILKIRLSKKTTAKIPPTINITSTM